MEKQRKQLSPEQDALEHILARRDKPFLEERFIDSFKGRGVFTHKAIEPYSFVVEYRGNIFPHEDTTPKKKWGDTLNNFLFEFSWKGAQWCVDASKEDKSLGRLVNDDHISPNCEMMKIVCDGKPHLCLFAVTEISRGEEITYNYGSSSYPWRSKASNEGSSTSYSDFYATSTPRNERLEDSSASCSDDAYEDDDGELPDSGRSRRNDSFADINAQLDFRDTSPFTDLDSSQEMTELHSDDASYTQQEAEVDFSSGEDEPSGATSFTTKNYCFVCKKGYAKITRHFLLHADEEPELAEVFALPHTSKERRLLLSKLRNRGNFQHNQEVLKNKCGEIKPRRKPLSVKTDSKTYGHCIHCKGLYRRKEMWRHWARCPSRTNSTTDERTSSDIALSGSLFAKNLPPTVWKMLSTMKQDEISSAVQNDFLLMQLAQYLSETYGCSPSKREYIRQKLREMGRLLLALHKKSIFSFEDAIKPKNFYKVVEAVKDIAGYDKKKQSYKTPSLALKIGHSLKKICTMALPEVKDDEKVTRDTKTFMKLCAKEWSQLVSQSAHDSLGGRKVSNPSTIPFTRDVQVFYRYLETTSASAIKGMKQCEGPQAYSALCRVTLAQASVLSKCAPEVSKMRLKEFQERDESTQVLSKHFIRINILSKTGQNVPVLLTSALVDAMTLLVNNREACGVHKDNPFLFAKPNSSPTSLYHGANCVRAFSSLCRAKNPEHLRSVHLHKHVARIFQILNLENDELDHLAKLLGHDIRADRDYYRLPEAAVELAKIAKLLLAMEKGSLERFKGNSLDEVDIEDELEPDVEQSNPENCDAEEDNDESDLLPQQSDAAEPQSSGLTPEKDALEHIKACRDKPFLEEMFIDALKGRGVFTNESIEPSAFVVEYRGKISSHKKAKKKSDGDTLNNYMFDFSWIGTNWRIDASKDDGSLGRLVNDDHISPNCEMKKIVWGGKPHLCLFAVTEISPGEEITYNYGDSSYPWRSRESRKELNKSRTDQNAAAVSSEDEGAEGSAGPSSSAASCCDEDYVPSTNDNKSNSFKKQSFEQESVDASLIEQEDETDYSSDDFTSDEEPKRPTAKRPNYCYVCGVAQMKISRHLLTHRDEEPDIVALLKARKNSKERMKLLEELRDRGNNKHNEKVLKTQCGELRVKSVRKRKPKTPSTAKRSAKKSAQPRPRDKTKVLPLIAAVEATDVQNISPDVRRLLSSMREDEMSSVIWNDSFTLQLAQYSLCQVDDKTANNHHTLLKLRTMGGLLLILKEKSICSIEDAIKPQNFSKLNEAVREFSGFNESTNTCDRLNAMRALCNSLKKIGDINYARALQGDADKERIQEAETFLTLCEKEWINIWSTKKNKRLTVPFIQDAQLFYQCLENTAASAVQSLTMYEASPVYTALLRVTLAQVSVWNKNFTKVSQVTLKSFKERDETELQEDAAVGQTELEKILSKHTVKINVLYESGKKVTMTLTPKLLAAVTLLVDKREACGVHKDNPFLFGKPDGSCTSLYRGHQCTVAFTSRCGAKTNTNLQLSFLRKHIARVFLILSLMNEELDQLAKLLGRDIKTDREYYQTPEAAGDIAKISELLSAVENGSLERFEGKSLEEIEIPDTFQPDVERESPENSDAEQDKSLSGRRSSSRKSSSKKRGRGRKKKQESEKEASEPNDERNEEVNTEKDDQSEETPVSCAANAPEETVPRSNEDATNMSFSDGDDDMNVDFDVDMDSDDDIVRNEENDGDGDSNGSAAAPLSPEVTKQDDESRTDLEETMDIDTVNHVEKKGQKKGREKNDRMDVESRSSSDVLNTEKSLAEVTGMKELKILIPKLDIKKFHASVKLSKLSSECNSVKSPVINQPIPAKHNQLRTPSASTDVKDKPSYAKATQMNCSHCKKSMLKGQTAYQKKGFTDVFCSKDCLFELFPINKPTTKTCYYCLKAISQPLDLIMAAVDIKGTMKDFCSLTCLVSFKSNTASTQTPSQLCSKCNKSCTATWGLNVNKTVHLFCSIPCMEHFRLDNPDVCDNCSSSCIKPLTLELQKEAKIICGQECLDDFKEKTKTNHQCTMCQTSQPISDMVDFKSDDNTVELFCTRTCLTSYKLRPTNVNELQEQKSPGQVKKERRSPPLQILNTEEVQITSDSTVNENDAPAAAGINAAQTLVVSRIHISCSYCGMKKLKGETAYKLKNSPEVFCSAVCLSEKNPHIKIFSKKCYNCFQVITRPTKLIRAPVDDSGTMKELCSDTCLASINSKRQKSTPTPPRPPPSSGPRTSCRMCTKFSHCKFNLTLDGVIHRICSDTCFINYRRINNLPMSICDACGCLSPKILFMLNAEDGSKAICSEECLVKFKEQIETLWLCPMCQTSHQLSDMVDIKNDEGRLDFFCSNRCMMVHKASTVSGRSSPSAEDNDNKEAKLSAEDKDIKEVKIMASPEEKDVIEVKPSLANLDRIKEEPIDEEYNKNLPSSISTKDIKDEPKAGDDVAKEGLKIGSVFSLTRDSSTSTSSEPTLADVDLLASCSNCKQVLTDGETVYQRKSHADIFCSTPCLLKFYQVTPVKKTCHFCLQGITRTQHVLQAAVDNQETMKDFCSKTCLSSFNYKRIVSTKMALMPVASQSQCSMCSRYCVSKHEIIERDVVQKICSDPCFLRYCNMNNFSICENCRSRCNTPLMLQMEDGSKRLCNAECLAQFKRKINTQQPCAMCSASHLMSDMVENLNSEDVVELFCSKSCVMASKIQAVSASGTPLDCDHCGKNTLPACHLAMSDASITNFCSLTCAMSFKETQKDMNAATNSTGAADQTQSDFLKPPEKLPCAQCRRIIKTTPKVVQKKDKMNFVCSLACSQEFKRVNNIVGRCEFCKNEKIIRDVKKVDGKSCNFCSDGCSVLFRHELEKTWGEHCSSCAYCLSISKTLVTAEYEGTEEEFCSEDCSSKFNKLLCRVALCDTCGRDGKLRQSLPMQGEVKHFCDLRCLLHFCNKKLNTVSSPPRPTGTVESSPVISNVMSLASALAQRNSALARRHSASASAAQHVSVHDIQTKVVGHASIQTVPTELKNKSTLCTPLVHNKGVSCRTETVDTEVQTDNFVPKVVVLPIPVPVYLPLPMNMYTQYTPQPVGLPLPLPVPVFLPDPTGKSMKESIQPDLSEGELVKKVQDERTEREDRVVTKEEQRGETHTPKDHTSNCSNALDSHHEDPLNNREDSSHLPPPLEIREDPPPAPPLSQQTAGKVHNKNKGRKLSSNVDKDGTSPREKVPSRKQHKLKSHHGTDAWKRWTQWKESQNSMSIFSSPAVTFHKEILHCSAAELSDSLCCFITEVRRSNGEPYSPDGLFYLCLSIQQYLFENGRMENIFSDVIYNKFSVMFTNILKRFKPSITSSGYIHSRVEEEYLWDCKQLGAYSPIVLLNTLLFFCCKYLGLSTVEQHRQLSFADFTRCTKTNPDNSRTNFLRVYLPVSINEPESDADDVPAKKRKKNESEEGVVEMVENTENPLRCPVRLYEFYLSKCPESVRQHSDFFYLRPDRCCVPSSPLWFSPAPLDDSTMEAMFVRTLAVRDLFTVC